MAENFVLDQASLRILEELQRDARQTMQQLSEAVGLSVTPCWKRVKEMESAGVIRGYAARVDRDRVGLGLVAVAEVNLSPHSDAIVEQFERAIRALPQVVRCVSTTGEADYLLTVVTRDIASYDRFLQQQIFRLPGIAHVRSSIVLREVKSDGGLPLRD